jgi:hypothetical protein
MLYLYKYIHIIIFPSTKSQFLSKINPTKNSADTIFFFGRLIGLAILFSEFHFSLDAGILLALSDFVIKASLGFVIYLASLYVIESIVLYNFEYQDEIVKRKNMSYALIGLSHSIGTAFILKTVLDVASSSLVMLIFLWFFSLVLIGFATKTFTILSKLPFNLLLIQKSNSIAISYFCFFLGWSMIIASSLNNQLLELKWYAIQVILKILLSIIILPIFMKGIKIIFNLEDDFDKQKGDLSGKDLSQIDVGYGIYEGATFFTACFLTIVITGRVYFGTFYPTF